MLFDQIVYGPIRSRRLGTSLGINLMPTDAKLCTFNCVYCECGWNTPVSHPQLPSRQQVREALESMLRSLCRPDTPVQDMLDAITFSGNGEPTLHPDFEGIILDTCSLRDRYCPDARISVLSNSTQLARPDVVRALKRVDNRIMKLDSAVDATMRLIDKPLDASLTVEKIKTALQTFNHDFTLQTCFLRGECEGEYLDNTTDAELAAYYRLVEDLAPKSLMIYVIDRATPCTTLQKIEPDVMHRIADNLRRRGFAVTVSC